MQEQYLIHHGIKGQKWGLRRYQYDDGSLTEAGRRRYGYDIDRAKKMYEDAKSDYKKYLSNETAANLKYARKEYQNEKIKKKISEENKVSKHRLKLESKYKEQGMTDEEAAIQSYKRARTEKIVAGAAAVAVIAATAVVAKKYYDKNVDKFLKDGVDLHRITINDLEDINNPFYAAYKNSDKIKYKGWLGAVRADQAKAGLWGNNSGSVYDVSLKAKDKIKIASPKHAKESLNEILNSSSGDTKKQLISYLEQQRGFGSPNKVLNKAIDSLNRGKVDDNVYKAFNYVIPDRHNEAVSKVRDQFFSNLKSKGYGGIQDVNDKLFSGYNAKDPLIIFGGDSVVNKIKATKVDDISIRKAHIKATKNESIRKLLKNIANTAGSTAVAGSTVAAGVSIKNSRDRDRALEYRREHPYSDKSLDEIIRMLERSKNE